MRKSFTYKHSDTYLEDADKSPNFKNLHEEQLSKHFYTLSTDDILLYVSEKFSVLTSCRPFILVQWILEIQFPFEADDKKI